MEPLQAPNSPIFVETELGLPWPTGGSFSGSAKLPALDVGQGVLAGVEEAAVVKEP